MNNRYLALVLAGIVAGAVQMAGGADLLPADGLRRKYSRDFVIKEVLNRNWPLQPVTYHLSFKSGKCLESSVRLLNAGTLAGSGKAGKEIPFQLSRRTYHKKNYLATCDLSFLAELPATQTLHNVMVYSGKGSFTPPAPASGLVAERDAQILGGKGIQVKIPLGEKKYGKPVPASDVPAPILAIRGVDGKWRGRARFVSPLFVTGYNVSLVENGPIFKEVEIRYDFEHGRAYTVTLRHYTDVPYIVVTEKSNVGPHSFVELDLYDADWRPDTGLVSWNAMLPFSLTYRHDKMLYRMLYFDESWGRMSGTRAYTRQMPVFEEPFTAVRCTSIISSSDESKDCIGMFAFGHDNWTNIKNVMPTLEERRGPRVFYRFPLAQGTRRWCLYALDKDAPNIRAIADVLAYESLDKMKDMVLSWPDKHRKDHPRLFCKPGDVRSLRAKVRGRTIGGSGGFQYLMTGDRAGATQAKQAVLNYLRHYIGGSATRGWFGHNIGPYAAGVMIDYDSVADADVWTPEERAYARAGMAYLAYKLTDPDFYPYRRRLLPETDPDSLRLVLPAPRLYHWNFVIDLQHIFGWIGLILADHQDSETWRKTFIDLFQAEMRELVFDSGCWEESPNYQAFVYSLLVPVVKAYQVNGHAELAENPKFKKFSGFFVDIMTAPDVRFKRRITPSIGDLHQGSSHANLYGANLYKDLDPELSARLMWQYELGGPRPVRPVGGVIDLVLGDVALPAKPQVLKSMLVPGMGAVLRANFGKPDEGYVLFKFGKLMTHMHDDEGTFIFYAAGAPISTDYGYWSGFDADQSNQANTLRPSAAWMHNIITVAGEGPGVLNRAENASDFITLESADLVSVQLPNRRARFYERTILYNKPDTLIIYDNIEADYQVRWYLHVLAKGVDKQPNLDAVSEEHLIDRFHWPDASRLTFDGKFGVDLDASFLYNGRSYLSTGHYGQPEYIRQTWIMMLHKLTKYTLQSPLDYFVVLHARKKKEAKPALTELRGIKGVKIARKDREEYVFLSPKDASYAKDDVVFDGRSGISRNFSNGKLELILLRGKKIGVAGTTLECKSGGISCTLAPDGTLQLENSSGAKDVTLRLGNSPAAKAVKRAAPTALIGPKGKVKLTRKDNVLQFRLVDAGKYKLAKK